MSLRGGRFFRRSNLKAQFSRKFDHKQEIASQSALATTYIWRKLLIQNSVAECSFVDSSSLFCKNISFPGRFLHKVGQ